MLRAMRRELETGLRRLLHGHAGGNPGYGQGAAYGLPRQFPTLPGASQTVALNTPGQDASLTFTGANAQRISLNMTNVTIGGFGTCMTVAIKNPDGSPLVSNPCVTTQGGFIDVQTLTANGTYTIAIDPPGRAAGSMTLTL
jgi:hypothetical protein